MHRTTIMLPRNLKSRALRHAQRSGISLGELIRESLRNALDHTAEAPAEDSLLGDEATFAGSAPKDLARKHDHYLYNY
ncbi:MAG TPA: CopG family transcriptional regulator [Acidobacteriota bacterium]|jgi:hypothetical protein|nr:CopG family transcriptional regulator [Acidobacteriota bacterium]